MLKVKIFLCLVLFQIALVLGAYNATTTMGDDCHKYDNDENKCLNYYPTDSGCQFCNQYAYGQYQGTVCISEDREVHDPAALNDCKHPY